MAEPDEATVKALRRVQDRVRLDAESLRTQAGKWIEGYREHRAYDIAVGDMLGSLNAAITQEFAPLFKED